MSQYLINKEDLEDLENAIKDLRVIREEHDGPFQIRKDFIVNGHKYSVHTGRAEKVLNKIKRVMSNEQ